MLEKLFSRLPPGSRDAPEHLREHVDSLTDEARQRLDQARHEAWLARKDGRVRLWTLSTRGLERAHELLDEAPPTLAGPLLHLVDEQLTRATTPAVPGYADLNARDACLAIRGLDLLELERIAHFELAHKDRKTVLAAIEREREHLRAAPAAEA